MAKALPTQHHLRQLLDYNPITGVLIWRERTSDMFSKGVRSPDHYCSVWNARFSGKPAGIIAGKGYVFITIKGVQYRAHQLIWIYMTGSPCKSLIDHKDGNKSNNCWNNLRQASNSENLANRGHNKNSLLGVKGVSMRRGKYIGRVTKDGQSHHLGTFETVEEASVAVKTASEKFFGEFAR